MHAIGNINAVSTFNIEAALASPSLRGVSRLLAQAGIERPTTRLKRLEVDAKLAASSLTPQERIAAKIGLERAGLIVEG